MRKIAGIIMKIIVIAIVLIVVFIYLIYYNQEKLIFYPDKIEKSYGFSFAEPFTEKYFTMQDGTQLHGLLFNADSSRGVIYYLHGNGGALDSWGSIAPIFTSMHYDLLIIDYRGYGKSGGKILNEEQLFNDNQQIYNNLKSQYREEQIIVLGYSIGTGMAAKLASQNHPGMLVLLAPYYNFPDLVKHIYPILPGFMLKYKLMTNEFLPKVEAQVVIFHGKNDELIPYQSSERLFELCKTEDQLFLIDNQQHNGINENPVFQTEIRKILTE